jgi:hypothetical protein
MEFGRRKKNEEEKTEMGKMVIDSFTRDKRLLSFYRKSRGKTHAALTQQQPRELRSNPSSG